MEAEKDRVRVLGPHVNTSASPGPRLGAAGIRAGLTTINGRRAWSARASWSAHAPYAALADLAMRVSARRVPGAKQLGLGHDPKACGGAIATLAQAKALDGLEHDPALLPPPKKPRKTKPKEEE